MNYRTKQMIRAERQGACITCLNAVISNSWIFPKFNSAELVPNIRCRILALAACLCKQYPIATAKLVIFSETSKSESSF